MKNFIKKSMLQIALILQFVALLVVSLFCKPVAMSDWLLVSYMVFLIGLAWLIFRLLNLYEKTKREEVRIIAELCALISIIIMCCGLAILAGPEIAFLFLV
ncbi:MAG: hypothetical protein E7012_03115 [Alphaproteobacteria bacterium]|nr:hypothetical protein [Alphaproteobacteria bacterium]